MHIFKDPPPPPLSLKWLGLEIKSAYIIIEWHRTQPNSISYQFNISKNKQFEVDIF